MDEANSKANSMKGFRGTPHPLTHDDRVKGGKAKSDAKKKTATFNGRTFCSAGCPMYPCVVKLLVGEDKRCAIKSMPTKDRKNLFRIMLGGKEDMLAAMKENMGEIVALRKVVIERLSARFESTKDEDTKTRLLGQIIESKKDLHELEMKHKKSLYGEERIISTDQPIAIEFTFKDNIGFGFKKREEKPVPAQS
jgi:hypothetical protein